jgi:predicted transcriptional regulator
MIVTIDLESKDISKFELSISELVIAELCNSHDAFDLKWIKDKLRHFDLKEDSIYRILKRLAIKGIIRYKHNPNGRHLYLIADEDEKVMKIGVSNNVKSRFKHLQTSSHKRLVLLFEIKDKGLLERSLHQEFDIFRLVGEWFSYRQEIIDRFNELATN